MLKGFRRGLLATGLTGLAALIIGCGGESSSPTQPQPNNPPPKQEIKPPFFNSTPIDTVSENYAYRYPATAIDPQGISLTYSINGPSWLSVDPSTGLVSGVAPEVQTNQIYPVYLTVMSRSGQAALQQYILTVKNLSNTYIISTKAENPLVGVQDSSLTFAKPVSYSIGDILASDTSQLTPFGVLRKIVSISNDKTRVNTQHATLEEVIKNGSFSISGTIFPSSIARSFRGIEGVTLSPNSMSGLEINLKDVVLWDDGSNKFTLNGYFKLSTNFYFNGDVSLINLRKLDFGNTSTVTTDLTLGVSSFGLASKKEIPLSPPIYLTSITISPPLVPAPIVIVPRADLVAVMDPTYVNPLSLRVKNQSSLDIGIKYDSNWDFYSRFSNSFDFSSPMVTGNWELGVYIRPKITFLIDGVVGASAGLSAGLGLIASDSSWSLLGKVAATLGVSAEVFSHVLASYSKNVLSYDTVLAHGTKQPPTSNDSTFTDSRDGQVYKLIRIGNQKWMAQNLNYNTAGSDYYQNNPSFAQFYGRLYDWNSSKTACPSNWHLPVPSEWETLFNSLGGINSPGTGGKMKSTGTVEAGTGRWHSPNTGATNDSKFTAQPGGMRDSTRSGITYSSEGYDGYFWALTTPAAFAYSLDYNTSYAGSSIAAGNPAGLRFSIRCVKN